MYSYLMKWKLFFDDERYPPDSLLDWKIARSYDDAVWMITEYGLPSFISFDHDMGYKRLTGMDFCKWFCNWVMDNNIDLSSFFYHVHSMNPVGKENIEAYMSSFLISYNEHV